MGGGDVAVLVANSNVKHQLTGSEYPTRQVREIIKCRAIPSC